MRVSALVLGTVYTPYINYLARRIGQLFAALSFLTDVVGLDMAKYNATLVSSRVEYPSEFSGLPQETGKCTLEADESKIDVTYKFVNQTLSYCKANVLNGSPIYAQPSPTSVLEAAKSILQKYQTYAEASYLQVMRDMLEPVTEIKPMTCSVGNVKLVVSGGGASASFSWIYTSNGLDFTRKGLSVYFEHDTLKYFWDDWGLYRIGSDSVNVSEEEAISIARNATKDIPKLHVNVGNDTWIVVEPKVGDAPAKTELSTRTKEPLTLYPFWHVQLYFDKVYYGQYGVAVEIWADTGEIIKTYPTGFMGGSSDGATTATEPTESTTETPTEPTETPPAPPPEENPTEPTTTEPATDDSTRQTNPNPTPLIIAVPTALAIILAATFYKKKKSTANKTT